MNRTITPPPSTRTLNAGRVLPQLLNLRHGLSGVLPFLEWLHAELGDMFQITLPGFRPVVVASPELIREVLTTQRDAFLWRLEHTPVVRLFRRGVLVTDGEEHDTWREVMEPSSRPRHYTRHAEDIVAVTDAILNRWPAQGRIPLLREMRRIALAVFERVYFSHALTDEEFERLYKPILQALSYIGPGPWIVTRRVPRIPKSLEPLEEHLRDLLRARRRDPSPPDDLLTHLVAYEGDDERVRDQMITMLIAGHDTSTAHHAWTLWLLGHHPHWLGRVTEEVRDTLGADLPTPETFSRLPLLEGTRKESLRLYPPIHVGNRLTARDVVLGGYHLPAGTHVMVSIYLVQRHPRFWEQPQAFRPERWGSGFSPAPFSYIPFGGGPRNCIGGSFATFEARLVLARILQRFDLLPTDQQVRPRMGPSLEPDREVWLEVRRR
jgi:cytochrome P450